MLTSIVVLLLLAAVAFVVILNQNDEKPTNLDGFPIEKIDDFSYETKEITTDLKDGHFVRVQFQIITDSKQAKKEISKRDFQLKNILIKELAVMGEEDFKSGLSEIEEKLTDQLNEVMTNGKVIDVYTINKILQ